MNPVPDLPGTRHPSPVMRRSVLTSVLVFLTKDPRPSAAAQDLFPPALPCRSCAPTGVVTCVHRYALAPPHGRSCSRGHGPEPLRLVPLIADVFEEVPGVLR